MQPICNVNLENYEDHDNDIWCNDDDGDHCDHDDKEDSYDY